MRSRPASPGRRSAVSPGRCRCRCVAKPAGHCFAGSHEPASPLGRSDRGSNVSEPLDLAGGDPAVRPARSEWIANTDEPMKSLGKRAAGLRLERMKASPLWAGDSFRNVHPVLPGLRDATVSYTHLTLPTKA